MYESSLDGIVDTIDQLYGPSRLVELGKIKAGHKGAERPTRSGGTFRLPERDDGFTIVGLDRDDRGDFIPDKALNDELLSKYGEDAVDPKTKKTRRVLRQIPVMLLADQIGDNLLSRLAWFGSKEIGAVSDGVNVTWFRRPENMSQKLDPPKIEPWKPEMLKLTLPGTTTPMFRVHSVLNVLIAASTARFGGIYKYRSASLISFRQLHASLVHISTLTGGILAGIPLMLVLRPMQVKPQGKPTSVYVTHLELRATDLADVQRIAMDRARYRLAFSKEMEETQRQYRALLVAPGDERPDEASDVASEFHPDTNAALDPFESRWNAIRNDWLQANRDRCAASNLNCLTEFQDWARATSGVTDLDANDWHKWTQTSLLLCEDALLPSSHGDDESESDDDLPPDDDDDGTAVPDDMEIPY